MLENDDLRVVFKIRNGNQPGECFNIRKNMGRLLNCSHIHRFIESVCSVISQYAVLSYFTHRKCIRILRTFTQEEPPGLVACSC